ncbi:MAG: SseB family protein [Ruminococcus sp.]|nr:SseB family protein [Ruminococcus sp.]
MAEEIKSEELLQAVADMREAYKAMRESGSDDPTAINEANTKVINLTLHSNFLVPAIISSNTQLVQDKENHLKFEDKPQARFMLVKHSQNGTFIPVFTDAAEFEKVPHEEDFKLVNMKFSDVATLTEQTPTVNGFVINPMTTNLPYTKEMLAGIKQTLIEARDRKLKEQQNAAAPNITVTPGESK